MESNIGYKVEDGYTKMPHSVKVERAQRVKKRKAKKKQQDNSYYQKTRERRIKQISANFERQIFNLAYARSRQYGVPFTITLDDIVIPEYCPYLNIKLTRIHGKKRVLSNASLDKIIPEKGYVKGNVQVISLLANMMKSSASIDQLLAFSEGIQRIHGKNA